MKLHSGLIDRAEDIQKLVERLRGKDIIAIDTEFIRETTFYPQVEVIQVASDEESWLIDAAAFFKRRSQNELAPLFDVFRDPAVLKVIHAAQGDQECLYTSFGILADPVFDTGQGASLCGYGENVGLASLLKSLVGVKLLKGHSRTNWSVRPLPKQLEDYAHADVQYLVKAAQVLLGELDQLNRREWAMELSARWSDSALYEPDIPGTALKLLRGAKDDKRLYSTLLKLVEWRENRVRQLNVPKRWVADDSVLADIAKVRPKNLDHLKSFRGIGKGELKKSGEKLLEIIHSDFDSEIKIPSRPRSSPPSESESQVVSLLKCYIAILAAQHKVAPAQLVTSSQLVTLLRAQAKEADDFVRAGVLTQGAADLVGEEVIALLQGKRALGISGKAVEIVEGP